MVISHPWRRGIKTLFYQNRVRVGYPMQMKLTQTTWNLWSAKLPIGSTRLIAGSAMLCVGFLDTNMFQSARVGSLEHDFWG